VNESPHRSPAWSPDSVMASICVADFRPRPEIGQHWIAGSTRPMELSTIWLPLPLFVVGQRLVVHIMFMTAPFSV
jgi:hypothetical protein